MQIQKPHESTNCAKIWRSCGDLDARLYSDIRITLTGNFSSSTSHGDTTTAIFSSHRFILVSRSPYFLAELLSWPPSIRQQPGTEPPILNLPSPLFMPPMAEDIIIEETPLPGTITMKTKDRPSMDSIPALVASIKNLVVQRRQVVLQR